MYFLPTILPCSGRYSRHIKKIEKSVNPRD
jgi:hypothetical protein